MFIPRARARISPYTKLGAFIFRAASQRGNLREREYQRLDGGDIPSVRYFSARDKRGKETAIVAFQRTAPANLIIRKSSPPPRERRKERKKGERERNGHFSK